MGCFDMTAEQKRAMLFHLRAAFYIIFILSYISGVVIFIVQFANYWAAGGFAVVILLIMLRLKLFLTPQEKLYHQFPPMSLVRAAYQGFFAVMGFTCIGLGFYLMAEGIKRHQRWTGESYFCSMTGVFMAAKWAFFVTIPVYDCRHDTLEPAALAKLKALEEADAVFTEEESFEQSSP